MSLWLAWRQFRYRYAIPLTIFEIKIPREINKSPKAMEHILTVITTLRNAQGNLREKWWDGEITQWFTFEIVSFGGEIHFYMTMPTRHAKVVRANIFAQYTDVEVEEVEDYMSRIPKTTFELYEGGYNLWGTELILGKEDGLPIRTYTQFEAKEEEQNLDPIGGILEVLSKLQKDEIVVLQILARPADPAVWPALVRKTALSYREETKTAVKSPAGEMFEVFLPRTPGETEKLKQIEAKSFKPAFDVIIRFVYFAPQSTYNVNFAKRGVRTAFYQYAAPNMNFFTSNPLTWTQAWIWDWPHIFPKRILEGRKQRILLNYRERNFAPEKAMYKLLTFHFFSSTFTSKSFLLNVEELATIFHLPSAVVLTGPLVKRVESRKIGPPAGLPIYKDERGLPGIMK